MAVNSEKEKKKTISNIFKLCQKKIITKQHTHSHTVINKQTRTKQKKTGQSLFEIYDLLKITLYELPHRCLFFLVMKRLILTIRRNKLHWYKTSLSTSRTSLSWYQTVRAVTLALILIGLNKTMVPL